MVVCLVARAVGALGLLLAIATACTVVIIFIETTTGALARNFVICFDLKTLPLPAVFAVLARQIAVTRAGLVLVIALLCQGTSAQQE